MAEKKKYSRNDEIRLFQKTADHAAGKRKVTPTSAELAQKVSANQRAAHYTQIRQGGRKHHSELQDFVSLRLKELMRRNAKSSLKNLLAPIREGTPSVPVDLDESIYGGLVDRFYSVYLEGSEVFWTDNRDREKSITRGNIYRYMKRAKEDNSQ